ncbi:hypothetical protein WDZ92_03475 [Nostoc sp. NIES-2111]
MRNLLLSFLAILALQGCRMYGYQPSILRNPVVDSAGKAEIAASVGPTVLTHAATAVQYSPVQHLLIGGHAAGYFRFDLRNSDDYFFFSQNYQNYTRTGFSGGLNAGYYTKGRTATLYLQGGTDMELIRRTYTEIESFTDTNGQDRTDYPVARYSARVTYMKPWVQASLRLTDPRASHAKGAFIMGLRVSYFMQMQKDFSYRETSSYQTARDYPQPTQDYILTEGYVGGEVNFHPLVVSLRLQARLNGAFNAWWYSPLVYANLGLTYQFGSGR